jgi:hypothetical protein
MWHLPNLEVGRNVRVVGVGSGELNVSAFLTLCNQPGSFKNYLPQKIDKRV